MIPIEDVERLSKAYHKQTATALKEAKDGKDTPTRGTPAGLIPVLERTEGLTIVPMKLLEPWQGWAKRRVWNRIPRERSRSLQLHLSPMSWL